MDNLQLSQGGSLAFTSGGLATGTTTGTIKTASAITYTIDGRFYSKAGTDNIAISYDGPDVYSDTGNGSFTGKSGGSTRLYCIYLDEGGNVSILPGPIANTAKLATGEVPLEFPPVLRNRACIGALRVAVTDGTTFIPGTTALNASGVTASFINLSSIPGEPLRS